MGKLTDDRNTPMRDGAVLSVPAAGGERFFAGGMAAVNYEGFAIAASSEFECRGAGRIESNVDNTAGADNDVIVAIRKGIFRYDNDDTHKVMRASIGSDCYIVDDQTVSSDSLNDERSVAGQVFDVDCDGVWVKFT